MNEYFGSSKKETIRRSEPWDISKQKRAGDIEKYVPSSKRSLGSVLRDWTERKIERVDSKLAIGKPFSVHVLDECADISWCRDLAKAAYQRRKSKSTVDHDEYQGVRLENIQNGAFVRGAKDIVEILEQSWAWNRPGCSEVDLILTNAFVVSYLPSESHMVHLDGTDLTINISLSEPGKDYDEGGLFFTSKRRIESTSEKKGHSDNSPFWERYMIRHHIGSAILQDAKLLHGASPIGRGERHNLILWCKVISRFSNWKRLLPHLRTRIFSYLSVQGIVSIMLFSC